jgi:hypothetical protein
MNPHLTPKSAPDACVEGVQCLGQWLTSCSGPSGSAGSAISMCRPTRRAHSGWYAWRQGSSRAVAAGQCQQERGGGVAGSTCAARDAVRAARGTPGSSASSSRGSRGSGSSISGRERMCTSGELIGTPSGSGSSGSARLSRVGHLHVQPQAPRTQRVVHLAAAAAVAAQGCCGREHMRTAGQQSASKHVWDGGSIQR